MIFLNLEDQSPYSAKSKGKTKQLKKNKKREIQIHVVRLKFDGQELDFAR